MTSTVPILAPELAKAVAAQRDRLDLEVLSRAYRISAQAHQGQKRLSGDDFVSHSVAVATILAEQQMDTTTIAAALLHDVVEDSDVTLEHLRRDFGTEVADLVDGLTKISTLTFRSTAEEQAENYRKLLMSVAKDARVIIIKLADRLHNMRTLDPLPADKRKRIALETRELYAPLAHRFGMAGVKAELEDLAFKHLETEDYRRLVRQVKARRVERDRTTERLRAPLAEDLRHAGIADWEITGRPKNLWSIYRKMKTREKPFEEIYDLLAMRVLVPREVHADESPDPDPARFTADIAAFEAANRLQLEYFNAENVPSSYDWHHEHNLDLLAASYRYVGQMKKAEALLRTAFDTPSALAVQMFNKREWPEFLIARGRTTDALTAAGVLAGHPVTLVRATGHIESAR